MLSSLSIRDVVLIDRLDLVFEPGLGVLTGETGAGKSILLDSLGLALGQRAEARLVRRGADQAVVTAAFDPPKGHPVYALLKEQSLDDGSTVILRRILTADGRSKAFINDQPVSVGLLREVGDLLVEVHGQFESQRLMNPRQHRGLLDAFGGLTEMQAGVAEDYRAWRAAVDARQRAEEALEDAKRDEEYLRHAVTEIAALTPAPGEETELAERRTVMQHGEKLMEAMSEAQGQLTGKGGVEDRLQSALRVLERASEKAGGGLDDVISALDRALNEATEAVTQLNVAANDLDLDPNSLEQVEERLFALRALARKHNVEVDSLRALHDRMAEQLAAIDGGGEDLERLLHEEQAARAGYVEGAYRLGEERRTAAQRLDQAMARELEPLKLGRAAFVTKVEGMDENDWNEWGCDRVAFEIATNPGSAPGPLNKIASGGELARFMLALKAVLAGADPVPTLVFDEVDAGIGGAVADAVGERLAGLARDVQVLVVTHSPQVAARGRHHWRVAKSEAGDAVDAPVLTRVASLAPDERKEEIARMLAGASVTEEARAAAASLLQGSGA